MADTRPIRQPAYPHGALPVGTRLGEFEVRRVLGVGGFGIVYLAFDHLLEREVALKEYMPSTLVDRAETMHVSLISQANADTFALGLRSFVNEARLLARFDHPSLVKVHRFWEANGTAYMAMALYKGRTVRDVRMELQDRPDEAWVRKILEPLLGAIERLHSEDVYHRDIAPDNILIEGDGRPVLLDFGAARRVITDRSQALTAILKPSYAPIEQYADVGGMKQGPWTDVYALGATMHFLLLGKPPPPAPGRSIQDTMPPLAQQALAGCSKPFLELIDWMLSPLPTDRPQSVAVVRDALAGVIEPPSRTPPNPYERTAPLTDYHPGNEDATVVIPRGQTALPPANDQSTVVVPRAGGAGTAGGGNGHSQPSRLATNFPAAPPRPPVADEDATIVTPYRTGMQPTQRPAPTAPPRQVAMPPMETVRPTTQYAPSSAATRPSTPPPPAPAPAPKAADASSSAWLTPVLAGIAVAGLVGGGLWWFLTRPAVPTTIANTPPAAVADPAPARPPEAVAPAPAPAPAVLSEAAPAPEASVVPPPVSTPPAATATPPPEATAPPAVRPAEPRPTARPAEPLPPVVRRPEPVPPAPAPVPAPTRPTQQSTAAPSQSATPAPNVTTATAPAPTPPADEGRPASPSERCAKELPLVRLICIDLACNRNEFARHPECVKLRADQANRRYIEGN